MQEIRHQAIVSLLSHATNEDTFLDELAVAYARCDIGAGLDFDLVRGYWTGGELDPAWRSELARQTNYISECESQSGYLVLDRLLSGVVQYQREHWPVRGERCLLLLAPLLEPVYLRDVIAPRLVSNAPHLRAHDLREQVAAQAAWAAELAAGEGDWRDLNALLSGAGADLAVLARIFTESAPEAWATDDDALRRTLRTLAQLQVAMLLLREHRVLGSGTVDPSWALGLVLGVARTYLELSRHVMEVTGADGLIAGLLRPLNRAASASPLFAEIAGRLHDGLVNAIPLSGMDEVLAEDEGRWERLLGELSKSQLSQLWLLPRFAVRFPAQALRYEQVKWRRCNQFCGALQTTQARAWYAQLLDEGADGDDFRKAFKVVFEGADRAQRRELIARHLINSQRSAHNELLDEETEAVVLQDYVNSGNDDLRHAALWRLLALALPGIADEESGLTEPQEPYWSTLRSLEATHADELIRRTVDEAYLPFDDPARWEALWTLAREERSRRAIARSCLRAVAYAQSPAALALAENLWGQSPGLFACEVVEFDFPLVRFSGAVGFTASPLRELVAAATAYYLDGRSWSGDGRDPLPAAPVAAAIAACPQSFAALNEKQQTRLLPLLNGEAVVACAEALVRLCAAPGKVLRVLLIELVARTPLAALRRSGLLDLGERKARLLVLTGLASNTDAAAVEAIAATIGDSAHDDFSRGLALDALERAGRVVDALDPWASMTLESLQAVAAKTRIPAAAAKAWTEEAARLLAPLGEALGRYLLATLLDADEVLPRRARQILAFLPAAQRADFAAFGLRTWIAENGSDKFGWLLLPLPEYGDERVVNDLVRAVKAWMKKRKPKASAAVHLLARLPGNYGIAQVRELWESRKFSESIHNNARFALEQAAQRQGMSFAEFLEQLVPDFGLQADGLRLDLGPYVFTARVRGDFSVVVVDADGKTMKTLPRARAGEDAERRGLAENQLKSLAKNLKPVYKQQSQRLLRNLQTGKTWPVAQWCRLFTQHPLLAVLSQSVVWSLVDAQGSSLARFRPNGSGATVDANDDDVSLGEAALVRVAHPLEMTGEEIQAWKSQFGDYTLISPFAQFDIPVVAAEPGELDAEEVVRAHGYTLNRAKFGSLVEKWGYIKGAGEDGALINEHTWRPDSDWRVTLTHSGISVFFDVDETTTIERLRPCRRGSDGCFECLPLHQLPPAFRATLLAQAEALKAAAAAD